MPVVELADKVALSPTACQRRLRRLEERGVIERYTAVLSPSRLGQHIQAFVRVSIERQSKDVTESFEEAVKRLPQVRACYVMTGDLDFLVHVMVPDLQAFADFSSASQHPDCLFASIGISIQNAEHSACGGQ